MLRKRGIRVVWGKKHAISSPENFADALAERPPSRAQHQEMNDEGDNALADHTVERWSAGFHAQSSHMQYTYIAVLAPISAVAPAQLI